MSIETNLVDVRPGGPSADDSDRPSPTAPSEHIETNEIPTGKEKKHVVMALADQAVFAITTFATSVMIGRLLFEAEFSLYYLAMTVVIVMANIQSELVTNPFSVIRFQFRGSELKEYVGSVLVHQLAISLLAVIPIAMMMGAAWLEWISPKMVAPLAVMAAAAPFILFRSFVRAFNFASYRFASTLWIDLVVGLTQLSAIIVLHQTGRLTVPLTCAVMGVSCLLGVLVWKFTQPETMRFNPSRFWSDWKTNWAFGKWSLACQLTGTTSPYAIPWILEAFHGESTTGVYGACFTLAGIAMHFVTAIANLLTPRAATAFVDGGVRSLTRVLWQATAAYVVVIGAISVGFLALGGKPVMWIYGDAFAGSGITCFLLTLFTLTIGISVVTGNGLWAVHQPRANLYADLVTMAATLGASFAFIPQWGAIGAACAMLTGASLGAIQRTQILSKTLKEIQSGRTRLAATQFAEAN